MTSLQAMHIFCSVFSVPYFSLMPPLKNLFHPFYLEVQCFSPHSAILWCLLKSCGFLSQGLKQIAAYWFVIVGKLSSCVSMCTAKKKKKKALVFLLNLVKYCITDVSVTPEGPEVKWTHINIIPLFSCWSCVKKLFESVRN